MPLLRDIKELVEAYKTGFGGLLDRNYTAGLVLTQRDQEEEEASSGGAALVKITNVHPNSPTGASVQRMFQGDLYGDGSASSATETDVTIRIAGLAPNIESYPTQFVVAVPIEQTWTPAIGTPVTETVYEVCPFVWWA